MTTTYQIQDISFDDNFMFLFIDGKKRLFYKLKYHLNLATIPK